MVGSLLQAWSYRTGRANQDCIMATGCGDLECPFNVFLSLDIAEVNIKFILGIVKFFPGIDDGGRNGISPSIKSPPR
jgi:hypothetical protein